MKFRGISFVDLLLMFRILFGMFIPSIQMEGVSFQEIQLWNKHVQIFSMFRFPRCCLEPFSFSQSNLRPQPIFLFQAPVCRRKTWRMIPLLCLKRWVSQISKASAGAPGPQRVFFFGFLEVPQVDTISNLGSNHLVLKSLRENVLRVVCCFKGFDSPIVQRFGSAGGCFFLNGPCWFSSPYWVYQGLGHGHFWCIPNWRPLLFVSFRKITGILGEDLAPSDVELEDGNIKPERRPIKGVPGSELYPSDLQICPGCHPVEVTVPYGWPKNPWEISNFRQHFSRSLRGWWLLS